MLFFNRKIPHINLISLYYFQAIVTILKRW